MDRLNGIYTSNGNSDDRLRAMSALQVTNSLGEKELLAVKEEYTRAWAIQFLCENEAASPAAIAHFEKMAKEDPSAPIRLYLASAMQRLKPESRWKIAEALLVHSEDIKDHNLPKMIWYGLEPLEKGNPAKALDLAAKTKIPMVTNFLVRRTMDADAAEILLTAIGKAPANQIDLLEGMRSGLRGRSDVKTPANWKPVYAELKQGTGKISSLATELAQYFGDTEAAKLHMTTLKNASAPVVQRQKRCNLLLQGSVPSS